MDGRASASRARAALISFFPLLVNTIAGLRSADEDRIDLMRSLAASELQIFRMLRLPSALPFIMAGLEVAMVFSLVGAIVAEFVGAEAGLEFLGLGDPSTVSWGTMLYWANNGGAIDVLAGGNLQATNNNLSSNTADFGGAFAVETGGAARSSLSQRFDALRNYHELPASKYRKVRSLYHASP